MNCNECKHFGKYGQLQRAGGTVWPCSWCDNGSLFNTQKMGPKARSVEEYEATIDHLREELATAIKERDDVETSCLTCTDKGVKELREELAYFTELPQDYDCDCGVCNFCNGIDWRVWKQRALEAESKVQELTVQLAKRDRVLKAAEWGFQVEFPYHSESACPICCALKRDGHREDCDYKAIDAIQE